MGGPGTAMRASRRSRGGRSHGGSRYGHESVVELSWRTLSWGAAPPLGPDWGPRPEQTADAMVKKVLLGIPPQAFPYCPTSHLAGTVERTQTDLVF